MLIIKKICCFLLINSTLILISNTVLAQDSTVTANDTILIDRNVPAEGVSVTGTITDAATKKALSGIRVKVDGFSAAITDDNGSFTIKVPSYNSSIVIEGEGYTSRRLPLKGRSSIAVSLIDQTHESFDDLVTT